MFDQSTSVRNIEPHNHGPRSRLTPAVVRSMSILGLVARSGPLGVSEIARELELPKSSVHELVHTLAHLGCLAPRPAGSDRFGLGIVLHELGGAYLNSLDLTDLAREVSRRLVESSGETVHYGVLDGTDVVYLVKVDSAHAVRMVSREGARLPAHCTAIGKALLSGLSNQDLRERYAGAARLPALTERSITHLDRLLKELERVRATGLSIERCESNSDVCCVAAPVRGQSGEVIAALSIATPTLRVADEWPSAHSAMVVESAHQLSRLAGQTRGPAVPGVAAGQRP